LLKKYFPEPRKTLFNPQVNISASASLSGGPAQNAKRKLRLKKEIENKYYLESLSHIYSL